MWPIPLGNHGWLLIGTSLLVFVLLGGAPSSKRRGDGRAEAGPPAIRAGTLAVA